jgi:hypothetical protein
VAGACSSSGVTLARQACVHVDASIKLYTRAEHEASTTSRRDVTRATQQLEAALPLAAQANSADPAFNPLMTTLQEMGRTSEGELIPALRAQCSSVTSPTSAVGAPPPGTRSTGAPPG